MIAGLIGWILLATFVGYVASERGRSAGNWFAISLFFSPLIGLLALIALPMCGRAMMVQTPQINYMAKLTGKEAITRSKMGPDMKIVLGVVAVLAIFIGLQWLI
jgi:hypothetical protein